MDPPTESVGTQLRRAREERGLDLLTVHDRLGRPITQIEALETGDMTSFPDETLALSVLRRYATFLGLDGNVLARQFVAARGLPPDDEGAELRIAALTSVGAAVSSGPDHLRAYTETGEVPQIGRHGASPTGTLEKFNRAASSGPPTGTFPVVPRSDLRRSRRTVARARRRMRAPTPLKVLTWFVVLLLAVVGAGFVLQATSPQTLANAHILRVVPAGSAAPSTGGSSGTTGTNPAPPTRQVFPVQPAGATPSSATYTVATSKFKVVVATSGPCWVQVTSSSSPDPLLSGVEPGGKVLAYPADGVMTVEVGSTAVLVGITIKGKTAFTATPKVIPFTYTFAPAG
ncbi:MAG: helix-turn-helix transcriptional regulator [Acidimicrobiales bacterium]